MANSSTAWPIDPKRISTTSSSYSSSIPVPSNSSPTRSANPQSAGSSASGGGWRPTVHGKRRPAPGGPARTGRLGVSFDPLHVSRPMSTQPPPSSEPAMALHCGRQKVSVASWGHAVCEARLERKTLRAHDEGAGRPWHRARSLSGRFPTPSPSPSRGPMPPCARGPRAAGCRGPSLPTASGRGRRRSPRGARRGGPPRTSP